MSVLWVYDLMCHGCRTHRFCFVEPDDYFECGDCGRSSWKLSAVRVPYGCVAVIEESPL